MISTLPLRGRVGPKGRGGVISVFTACHPHLRLRRDLPLKGEVLIYRFKLPRIPRTSARPTCVATVRAMLFIVASRIVSR